MTPSFPLASLQVARSFPEINRAVRTSADRGRQFLQEMATLGAWERDILAFIDDANAFTEGFTVEGLTLHQLQVPARARAQGIEGWASSKREICVGISAASLLPVTRAWPRRRLH